ncbi:hypothetical protein MMC21_003498 [Puttea exsequens]|nr:hypothetical protein [Puttea exsequens]
MCSSDIFLGLLAILFPPIAVWIKSGICSADSVINILLCCLGYVPGLIHAWYIIALYPESSDEYESIPQDYGESGRVTYYYISHRPSEQSLRQQGLVQGQQQQPPRGYGTTDSMRVPQQQQPPRHEDAAVDGDGQDGIPPSYEQAIQGDHKVQT